MVVYIIDEWDTFLEAVATSRYKLYRVKKFDNKAIVQAKAGRLGFEKTFDLTNPKEKEEFERIMNDIKIWDFVEVKKVVNDDEFFY